MIDQLTIVEKPPEFGDPRLPDDIWTLAVEAPTGCWLYGGNLTAQGYGILSGCPTEVERYVHRLSYAALVGPLDPDLELDHLCRVRECFNPGDLEQVTHRENCLRSPLNPCAINARKVECVHQHPLVGPDADVWVDEHGHRHCRPCMRERRADPDFMERRRESSRRVLAKMRLDPVRFERRREQKRRAMQALRDRRAAERAAGFPT